MTDASTERANLTRTMIAQAALAMTDEVGLAGLSMRKLGASLGVEAMSLYHYVDNKDDLLDAVLEQLYLEIELPRGMSLEDWEESTRGALQSFHEVLLRHPAAFELFSSRPTPSIDAYQVLMWAITRLMDHGLDLTQATKALHFAISFVFGFAATETGVLAAIRSGEGLDPDSMRPEDGGDAIRLIGEIEAEAIFQAGLDGVVAGLRSMYGLP